MLKSISRTPTAIGKLEKLANADFYHNEKTIRGLTSSDSGKHQSNFLKSLYRFDRFNKFDNGNEFIDSIMSILATLGNGKTYCLQSSANNSQISTFHTKNKSTTNAMVE